MTKPVFKFLFTKLITCLCLTLAAVFASAQLPVVEYNGEENLLIPGKSIGYLPESGVTGNFREILPLVHENRFTPITGSIINLGIAKDNYWIVFTVRNNTIKEKLLYLRLQNPRLNRVEAYYLFNNSLFGTYAVGDLLPFSQRVLSHNEFVLPVTISKDHPLTILLRVQHKGNTLQLPISLCSANGLLEATEKDYLFIGIATGVILLTFFFSLFFYTNTRKIIFLVYCLYILAVIIWLWASEGYAFQFLWPQSPRLANIVSPAAAAMVSGLLLLLTLLFTKGYLSNRILRELMILLVVLNLGVSTLPLNPLIDTYNPRMTSYFLNIAFTLYMVNIIVQTLFLLHLVLSGYRLVIFYLAAVVCNLCSTVLIVGKQTGRFDVVMSSGTIGGISIMAGLLLLTIGIAWQFSAYEKDKERLSVELNAEKAKAAEQVLATQELERKRIAEDLHDELGGTLAAIKLNLKSIKSSEEEKERLIKMVNRASVSVRNISHNLMPPDFSETRFLYLLDLYFQKLNMEGQTTFHFHHSGEERGFSKQDELIIYRIIMELTNNIIRHAEASTAKMELVYGMSGLDIKASDNGKGLSSPMQQGIGLKNIRSRVQFLNGAIEIRSDQEGTFIGICLPYKQV